MKNLVLKTTAITLACAFGLLAIIYGVFALFIPRPLANLFDKMGMYNASIRYYEKTYNKSTDMEDLYTLCLKLDGEKDSEKIERYAKLLVENVKFIPFSKTQDIDENGITTEEYVEAKYVRAVYKNKGIDSAISATTVCLSNGYNPSSTEQTTCYHEYNPFLMLLTDESIDWSAKKGELQKLKDKITAIYTGQNFFVLSEIEKSFAERDLAIINGILA